MIKSKFGPIRNNETGEEKYIVVNALSKVNCRDIVIGAGITLIGITYLTLAAFKNGAHAYDKAEMKTLGELGLLHPIEND